MGYLVFILNLEDLTELPCLYPPEDGSSWLSSDFCDLTDPQIIFHIQLTQLIQLKQSNHIELLMSISNLTAMI